MKIRNQIIYSIVCIFFIISFLFASPIPENKLKDEPLWYKSFISWNLSSIISNKYLNFYNHSQISQNEALLWDNNIEFHINSKFTFLSWSNGKYALISNTDNFQKKKGDIITRNLDSEYIDKCLYWESNNSDKKSKKNIPASWICAKEHELILYQWDESLSIKSLLSLEKGKIKAISMISKTASTIEVISCCRDVISIDILTGAIEYKLQLKKIIPEKLHTIYSVKNVDSGLVVYGVGTSLYKISFPSENVERALLPYPEPIFPYELDDKKVIFKQISASQNLLRFEGGIILNELVDTKQIESFSNHITELKNIDPLKKQVISNLVYQKDCKKFVLHSFTLNYNLSLYSTDSNGKTSIFFNGKYNHNQKGNIRKLLASESEGSVFSLLLSEDDSLSLISNNGIIWEREEGLGNLLLTQFFKLPSKISEEYGYLQHSLNHVKYIVSTLKVNMKKLLQISSKKGLKSDLTNDSHGFNRLIIAVSNSGKIYAIRSENGEILWSFFHSPFQSKPNSNYISLHPNDSSSFYIVNRLSNHVFKICLLSGQILQQDTIPPNIQRILPISDSNQNILLLIDSKNLVYVFPNDIQSKDYIRKLNKDIYFNLVDKAKGQITGYIWESKTHETKANEIWKINLNNRIESTAEVGQNPIYSAFQIFNSKLVKKKYINPNLMAVATIHNTQEKPYNTLDLYIINVVTGDILHHMSQENAGGPIHLIFDDNVLLLHFMNTQLRRFIVSVTELYHADKVLNNRSLLDALFGRDSSLKESISSLELYGPQILRQNFILPLGEVETIFVTKSKHGLTKKDILFGMKDGRVVLYEKSLLESSHFDSKIPQSMSTGILKLSDTHHLFSYNYSISNIKEISSHPSDFESTIHILVRGKDLFYRRLAPLNEFDMLGSDFSHVLILTTIVALLITLILTRSISTKKRFHSEWL